MTIHVLTVDVAPQAGAQLQAATPLQPRNEDSNVMQLHFHCKEAPLKIDPLIVSSREQPRCVS